MNVPDYDITASPLPTARAAGRSASEEGTVAWPGGADLAPDTLHERVRTGAWPKRHVAA